MPDIMPDYLKDFIRNNEIVHGVDPDLRKVLWISCEGENPADVENIGPMQYRPMFGFDGAYFPVVNKEQYLRPLVAVFFERPARGVLINIECKAWARNIKHEEEGTVHFELMVD
ncbi:hypothetical protein ILUMI_14759 [Ignelater luminosus]|uniref:Uncharacterized protein n=1 Tax=Ignelater luminosus TaxID=2038154 RepID=A0A8K0CPW5_IGNLU|nr:hypothetical protein ILUMI_14759 [Ignelater luminosus]